MMEIKVRKFSKSELGNLGDFSYKEAKAYIKKNFEDYVYMNGFRSYKIKWFDDTVDDISFTFDCSMDYVKTGEILQSLKNCREDVFTNWKRTGINDLNYAADNELVYGK